MALKATVYKANIQLSDLRRHYYQNFNLTLAQHPSETEQRLMVRLAAYLFHADEQLQFTRGLSSDDEPEIWLKNLSLEIQLWIELGTPSEERIRKACARSQAVVVYVYGAGMDNWWQQINSKLSRFKNLTIVKIELALSQELTQFVKRSMALTATIEDDQLYLSDDSHHSCISLEYLLKAN
jgi:uncharacterized protein YaeQ